MLKSVVKPMVMVLCAAAIAALATFASAGGGGVSAGPLPAPQAAAIKSCADRPWPYLNCVGTPFGSRTVRLVTTDRLPGQ